MADRKGLADSNDTPEDVATLYSWANLHGAKYRDFSASRAQTREKARLRVEEAIETERRRVREESEAQKRDDVQQASEADRQAEQFAMENTRRFEQQAAERAAEQEAHERSVEQQAAQREEQKAMQRAQQESHQRAWQSLAPAAQSVNPVSPRQRPFMTSPSSTPAQFRDWQSSSSQASDYADQVVPERQQTQSEGANGVSGRYAARTAQSSVPPPSGRVAVPPQFSVPQQQSAAPHPADLPPAQAFYAANPAQPNYPEPAQSQPYLPLNPPTSAPMRGAPISQVRPQWETSEPREILPKPAWLSPERPAASAQPQVPQAPEDTLQSSRDRLTSRWFALKTVFAGPGAPAEVAPAPVPSRAPILAVFSLAGGVGKTSLVATLGRSLSARGERVLLVDTAAYGLLPFFFGARDQRPGVLRTFTPPGISGDAPIQTLTIDPEGLGPENSPQEPLSQEITRNGRGVSRVIVDLATASGATTRRVLRMAPTVLVPLIPDMSSVVSVSAIDAFFQGNTSGTGQQVLPYYVVNQFDSSVPLHLDVREVLREQLGDRLLPFALRRTPALSEALAEGMTLVDYAPNSPGAEDFGALASWVKSLSPPASTGYRGVRWSER